MCLPMWNEPIRSLRNGAAILTCRVRYRGNACIDLTGFNKIAIQGTPQMAVDKEAIAYRESTHIVPFEV